MGFAQFVGSGTSLFITGSSIFSLKREIFKLDIEETDADLVNFIRLGKNGGDLCATLLNQTLLCMATDMTVNITIFVGRGVGNLWQAVFFLKFKFPQVSRMFLQADKQNMK